MVRTEVTKKEMLTSKTIINKESLSFGFNVKKSVQVHVKPSCYPSSPPTVHLPLVSKLKLYFENKLFRSDSKHRHFVYDIMVVFDWAISVEHF